MGRMLQGLETTYQLAYLPAGLEMSAVRREPVRGAPSMNTDQREG
jgi:hypothetical protein